MNNKIGQIVLATAIVLLLLGSSLLLSVRILQQVVGVLAQPEPAIVNPSAPVIITATREGLTVTDEGLTLETPAATQPSPNSSIDSLPGLSTSGNSVAPNEAIPYPTVAMDDLVKMAERFQARGVQTLQIQKSLNSGVDVQNTEGTEGGDIQLTTSTLNRIRRELPPNPLYGTFTIKLNLEALAEEVWIIELIGFVYEEGGLQNVHFWQEDSSVWMKASDDTWVLIENQSNTSSLPLNDHQLPLSATGAYLNLAEIILHALTPIALTFDDNQLASTQTYQLSHSDNLLGLMTLVRNQVNLRQFVNDTEFAWTMDAISLKETRHHNAGSGQLEKVDVYMAGNQIIPVQYWAYEGVVIAVWSMTSQIVLQELATELEAPHIQ